MIRLLQVMASRAVVGALLMLLAGTGASLANPKYEIGTYYFPGWSAHEKGAPFDEPWEKIKPFPDRKPLLGWYDDGDREVLRKQLEMMHSGGISFVAFDWYFYPDRTPRLNRSIDAYLSLTAAEQSHVKFALLWANHSGIPKSQEDWDVMVEYWLDHYLSRPEYLRVAGKPVVFIFSALSFQQEAASFGTTPDALLAKAQIAAQGKGLSGIFFVAGTGADPNTIGAAAKASGYSAFSAYNYQTGPSSTVPSHSYAELDSDYRAQWEKFARLSSLPLIVPLSSGWDRRPWGGSTDPLHDNSESSPAEFAEHVRAAKEFLDRYPSKTVRMAVVCCWNEFGEGSFIEPTEVGRFSYLNEIRSTFTKGAR